MYFGRLLEIVKVARPGFWPTQLWFYVLPMGGVDLFGEPAFWIGAAYVCFPLGLLLYGWNDLGDVETDRINPRKNSWLFGGRPDAALRAKLPWIIAAVQLPFLVAFIKLAGPRMLIWFAAVLLVNWTYNNLKWKARPGLDLLNQIGYLLVFMLAVWLCDLDRLSWQLLAFSALFAMQSHLFGQLMDVDEDKIAGRRSTAITLGVHRSKLLLTAMMMIETMIAITFFRGPIVAVFMGAGATFFALDAWWGPRRYPVFFSKVFFLAWNIVVLASMHLVWRYEWFLLK